MGNAREIRRNMMTTAESPVIGDGQPPALPPRPSVDGGGNGSNNIAAVVDNHPETGSSSGVDGGNCSPCSKKYVLLCAACGGLAVVLGSLFAVLYVVLRSYTSSLHYFETVPSYVASVSLIVTGLLMLCFGWRRNRFGYLVKLCGFCCLVCAVVCVVITVTTTVVHMNRLQTLRECVYNARGRSCTCFTGSSVGTNTLGHQLPPSTPIGINSPVVLDSPHDQGSAKYIFADTPDCEVVHGALYACLRALFGLSVIGILVSLFSGMLVYQLLGHERKKMYWEQLELRSRALFRRQHTHPPIPCCGCCQDCRFPPSSVVVSPSSNGGNANNLPMLAWPPWDVLDDRRYWSLHGGNLYSPGPCADAGPSSPGSGTPPCGSLHHHQQVGHPGAGINCPAHHHHHHHHHQRAGAGQQRSGNAAWNWLPWRPSPVIADTNDVRTRRAEHDPTMVGPVIIGPDDHYGFPLSGNTNYRPPLALSAAGGSPVSNGNRPERAVAAAVAAAVSGWGPPPPYSSRGSNSELGSISTSTPMSLSPVRISPLELAKIHTGASGSPNGSAVITSNNKELGGSMRKSHPQQQVVNLPPRRKSGVHHPSPVNRMDPRRMPWSPQTAGMTGPVISHGHSNSFPAAARSLSMIHQTSSPLVGREQHNGNTKQSNGETDIYFGDTSSSYTVSVHNDGSNSSAMYEEIHGHRYDKIQRPLAKVTSMRNAGGGKPCQRSSWDGQNNQLSPRTSTAGVQHRVATAGGQPRTRHSADTVTQSKEKMFSPIVVPKVLHCPTTQSNWVAPQQNQQQRQQQHQQQHQQLQQQQPQPETADTCSFVPYRRAAVVPTSGSFAEPGEVYENVTNLDFDEKKKQQQQPRTLSPDEEVAILTSMQFHAAPVELNGESNCNEVESDNDSAEEMRAVNV